MAKRSRAHAGQVPGTLFVDDSCIDCGTCYHYVPEVFRDADGHSVVGRQPTTAEEQARAHLALIACPTSSIGSDDRHACRVAAAAFPQPVTDGVSFNGYTQEASFGAWSYLVQRADGNVLVDCPRAAQPLRDGIAALGGVSRIVLSHRDDIAGHETHAAWWQAPRIAHRAEGIAGIEQQIDGDEPVALARDLLLIPTPGHTPGSVCLLFDRRVLFTGDHLWWNPHLGGLSASRSHCWYDWSVQLRSLERLLAFDFTWVCPGHGAMHQASDAHTMRATLAAAIRRLRAL